MFRNRDDAAGRLARSLAHFAGTHPLVLAIPRGAVRMGRIVADALGGDLDLVLVRKIGAPGNPEFALGAIDESGWTFLGEHLRAAGADDAWIEREKRAQLALMQRRRTLYTPSHPPLDPSGRNVIVVDDGLATGATMIAALHAVRAKRPARLVCAVPVAAPDSLAAVRPWADEVVCLEAPREFFAVGQFYAEFDQVEDDEVIALLAAPAPRAGG